MKNHFYADLEFNEFHLGRPFIALNMVGSLDGKVTLDGTLRPGSLGSTFDRKTMNIIRSHFDAVLMGGNTARQHPFYLGVSAKLAKLRTEKGLASQPLTVLLTKSGRLDPCSPLFKDPPRAPLIFTSQRGKHKLSPNIINQSNLEIIDENTKLNTICSLLQKKYGVNRLLVEGGPSINYQFLKEQLLDEVFITLAPRIIGATSDLSLVMGDKVLPNSKFSLISSFQHENELFLRYAISCP
ncbi:MAG: RibD family protein [Bacillota bacterium]|nr:RibD family protein [Bacillota bacterium]HHU61586.1 RibD family protein [Natronincola sp.]